MNISKSLQSFAGQPVTHQLLSTLLKDYKRPNDKIYEMINAGELAPIRRGLYVVGPGLSLKETEPYLLANHIYGPSYISLDTALSYYGLIPERVYEISSMTTKISRSFKARIGSYTYTHLPLPYYAFGITQVELTENQYALFASAEKALCDKVVSTAGLILRNQKSAAEYLLENLRVDEERLRELDADMILSWINDVPKKESLLMLIKAIKNL